MLYIYKTKFASESEYRQLVAPLPEWLQSVESIVTIGTIIKPATFDEEGNELTAAYEVEGYHVDVLASEVIPELVPYCLTEIPNTPVHGNGWAENEYEIVLNRAA